MEPLFQKLFRYRQSEKRTPTEDFLNELLTDWLSRAPRIVRIDFIATCFVPAQLREAFRTAVGTGDLEVRCHVGIANRKSVDLLVSSEGTPLVVIESKISARFQMHRRESQAQDVEATEDEYDHQLQTYGRWLADQTMPDGWLGVITLLTHISTPPENFESTNSAVYGAVPHVYSWRTLCGRISEVIGADIQTTDEPPWKFVGRELCRFLESNDMNLTDLQAGEIAALNVAMMPARRTTALFAEVGTDLTRRYPDEINGRRRNSNYEVEHGRVWGWSYLKGDGDIYLAYGIYFYPFVGHFEDLGAVVPPHEQAFIAVGSDKASLPANQSLPTTAWVRVSENWLIIHPIPLNERLIGERFPEFFLRAIDTNMEHIRGLAQLFRENLPT